MRVLVTGAAGFIGSNAVRRFRDTDFDLLGLDNLSRPGARQRLDSISNVGNFRFEELDLTNYDQLSDAFLSFKPEVIIHLAGQVAVTTSVLNPRLDFNWNVLATLNILELSREMSQKPLFIFASTNKVYGNLSGFEVREEATRYTVPDLPSGINEEQTLDFHSPYGCSKGAADQYVLDYARTFGLPTVVFRQSCIYGPNQFGVEDQGWIAWFLIAAALNRPTSIFGTGKQVRDALHVDDLIDAYLLAIDNPEKVRGEAFNVGGGPGNTLSVLELISEISKLTGAPLAPVREDWRPGDQKVYVSNLDKIRDRLDWQPKVDVSTGLRLLNDWIMKNSEVISRHV